MKRKDEHMAMELCLNTIGEFLTLVINLPSDGVTEDEVPVIRDGAEIAMRFCDTAKLALERMEQHDDVHMEIAKHLAKGGAEA